MVIRKQVTNRIDDVRRFVRTDSEGNRLVYYSGLLSSDIAKHVTFVPVTPPLSGNKSPLNESTDGYQRPGDGARMRQFAKYLEATPLAVVPPVLLSTRNDWKFIEGSNRGFGHLEISGPAAIIDGQHRLGGFVFLHEKFDMVRDIDFVAFENLALKLESKVFNTINGKAKGVPKGIGKIIEGSWSTRVVQMLMDSQDSPFFGKIYIANKKETPGALFNLSSFDKEVIRTFSHGSFSGIVSEENIDLMYEIMQGYWDLIAEFFPVEWEDIHEKSKDQSYKLMELTGIIAFSSAAGDILGPNFDFDAQTMDWEQVRAILEALAEGGLDLRKNGEFAGFVGFIGGPKIHKKIQRAMANMDL